MYEPPKKQSGFKDVGDFHTKFGLHNSSTPNGEGPQEVPRELLEFRLKFLIEEIMEFAEAIGYVIQVDSMNSNVRLTQVSDTVHHAKAFDALIDEVYVAYGTAHLMGYPWQRGWDLVQKANMAKERATAETASERGGTFDVVKPEGWVAPDIEALLTLWGYKTTLNDPELKACHTCGIVRYEHHSEIDHSFREAPRR